MLTYLGALTMAAAIPLLGLMDAALIPIKAELTAKLAAMIKLSFNIGLRLPAVTAALMAQAALLLAAQPPQIGLNASLAAAAVLKLQAQLEAILLLPQYNLVGGVHAFVYEGRTDGLGPALDTAHVTMGVAPGQDTYAVILIGTAGATQTALKAVFKTP